jgi:ubiquinone/menaquinone biosynthesis C-methylase UbiE
VRCFFHLLYNQFAWAYDLVAWLASMGHWRAWGRTALPHLCGEQVLELGHGPGHLLAAMAERGLAPVGVDPSPSMGRLARRRLAGIGVAGLLVRARAQSLPFRSGSFDSAVATFPTEFILDPASLQEAARVLRAKLRSRPSVQQPIDHRAGGRLVVVAWARLSTRNVLARVTAWLYRVTGQAEPLPGGQNLARLERWFDPTVTWAQVGSTQVMLVVAEKRGASAIPSL